MKKTSLLMLIVLVLLPTLSIHAQEEDSASCTADQFETGTSIVSGSFEDIQTLMEISDEPTASELTGVVASLDAYATGYWEAFLAASEEGLCTEVDWLGYTGGIVLDEALITTQLSALAAYENEAGNTDLAEALVTLAQSRAESLDASLTSVGELLDMLASGDAELNFELAECTEEELTSTYDGLEEIGTAYEEFGDLADELESEDFSALIVGYATLSAGYWAEFMPVVPGCAEAQDEAYYAGLIIDESLIIVSSLRLAELEAEFGDADVASVLVDSATTRLENLSASTETDEEDSE